MSLRLRMFLLFGGLVAALVVAQWWLVRSLTRDLSAELGEVAFAVGRDLIVGGLPRMAAPPPGDDASSPPPGTSRSYEQRRVVVRHERVPLQAPGATVGAGEPGDTAGDTGEPHMRFMRVEEHVVSSGDAQLRVAAPGGGPAGDASAYTFEWVLDEPEGRGFLRLGGPGFERMIPIPERGVKESVEGLFTRFVLGSAGILLAGLVAAAVVAHRVAAPLRRLAGAARRVGEGHLGTQAPVGPGGEVGEAIASFNRMSAHLERLDADARALRARQHLAELGEMTRGLAHTLRNPLNALGLNLESLAERLPTNEGEALASARRQIQRIDRSIRSFLAFSSPEAATVADVNFTALVRDVALEAIQDGGGRVRVDAENLPVSCTLPGVEPELRAVVQALVVNAIEASPDGGTVRLRLEERGAGVRLWVEDEGAGLPAEVRERLFTPHVTTKPSGSGLGLFLAHRIATTRYEGALELRPRDGGGTQAVLDVSPRKSLADG